MTRSAGARPHCWSSSPCPCPGLRRTRAGRPRRRRRPRPQLPRATIDGDSCSRAARERGELAGTAEGAMAETAAEPPARSPSEEEKGEEVVAVELRSTLANRQPAPARRNPAGDG